MRVEVLRIVEHDLDEIAAYIARDSPRRAVTFVQEIRAEFLRIAESPTAYPARDDLKGGIRMGQVGQYLIFFRVGRDFVQIRRVLHGARRLNRQPM